MEKPGRLQSMGSQESDTTEQLEREGEREREREREKLRVLSILSLFFKIPPLLSSCFSFLNSLIFLQSTRTIYRFSINSFSKSIRY